MQLAITNLLQEQETHRTLTAQRAATQTELSSKRSQVEALKVEIGDLPSDAKIAIDEYTGFVERQRAVESYILAYETASAGITELAETFEQERLDLKAVDGALPADIVEKLRLEVASALGTALAGLLASNETLSAAQTVFVLTKEQADYAYTEHGGRYDAATSQMPLSEAALTRCVLPPRKPAIWRLPSTALIDA